jgi:predicted O-linked N-acetylglucosamine transferase (SPINDLY family)
MEDGLYSEKVYRLPATRLCMVPPESAPEVNPLPALHHPDKVIQLASFQEMNKITDEVLVIWWQLIAERSNIHMRFQSKRMGQEPDRIAFTKRLVDIGYDLSRVQLVGAVDRDAYFAVYSSVDFIIDTFPYPGGTTTAEALWMGVPTLTLTGVGMLQRQGEGLLKNVGLADWVCHSTKEMQSKFNSIISADGLQVLTDVRQGLRIACQQSALFDGRLFASQWMEVMQAIISER